MELVAWNKSLETGHPIVDGQHKNLFAMINNLHTSIQEGHSNLVLIETMEKLSAYVETHFKTEEELMISHHYEQYAEHKLEHDNLREQSLKLIKLFGMHKVDLTATVNTQFVVTTHSPAILSSAEPHDVWMFRSMTDNDYLTGENIKVRNVNVEYVREMFKSGAAEGEQNVLGCLWMEGVFDSVVFDDN